MTPCRKLLTVLAASVIAATVASIAAWRILTRPAEQLVMVGPGFRLLKLQSPAAVGHFLKWLRLSGQVEFYRIDAAKTGLHSITVWLESWNSNSPKAPTAVLSVMIGNIKGNGRLTVLSPTPRFPYLLFSCEHDGHSVWGEQGPLDLWPKSHDMPIIGSQIGKYIELRRHTPAKLYPRAWRGRAQVMAIFESKWGREPFYSVASWLAQNPAVFPDPLRGSPNFVLNERAVVTYVQVSTGIDTRAPVPVLSNGHLVLEPLRRTNSPSTRK